MVRFGKKTAVACLFAGVLAGTIQTAQASLDLQPSSFSWKGASWVSGAAEGTGQYFIDSVTGYLHIKGDDTVLSGYQTINMFSDTASAATVGSPSWSVSFSFIDHKNADNRWPSIELFDDSLSIVNDAGNPGADMRFNGGAANTFQGDLPGPPSTRFRTAGDRNTIINGYGGTPGDYSLANGDPRLGFDLFTKDNFAANARGGGTVESPLYAVTSGLTTGTGDGAVGATGTTVGTHIARVADVEHTVTFGKKLDGSLDMVLDGNVVINYDFGTGAKGWASLAAAGNFPDWDMGRIALIIRGAQDQNTLLGETIILTDYSWSNVYPSEVPEPASLGLLGVGMLTLLKRRRRA